MIIEFEKVIRGQTVTVHTDDFSYDPSVGVPLGPEFLWADTEDGKPFDLTEDEEISLAQEATEAYLGHMEDAFYE